MNMTEELGKYFGYPSCCIASYEEIQSNGGRKSPEQAYIAATSGGGFIPCEAHAKQVIEEEITLHSLINNRVCPLPFPQEPPIEVIDDYLTESVL